MNLAHIELAFGDLTDELCLLPVVQIDVVAAIALTGPQNAASVLEIMTVETVIVHILRIGLLNDGAYLTCLCIQFQQSVSFMPTLVERERQGAAVAVPMGCRYFVLLVKQFGRRLDDASCSHFDNNGHTIVQRVARLGILLLVQHRLDSTELTLLGSSARHRLHVIDIALGGRFDTDGRIVTTIR